MHRIKRLHMVPLGVIGCMLVAIAAYAYGTGGGGGSGTGNVGAESSVTLTGTVTEGIAPGVSVPVSFTARKGSDSAIRVSTVHLDGVTADGGHAARVTNDFSMADVTEDHQVPALAPVDPLPNDGTLVYADTPVSQDACKGATLTVALSST